MVFIHQGTGPPTRDELAQGQSKISLTITTYDMPETMKLWLEGCDPVDITASIYIDPQGQEVWMCKWLTWYFGSAPENL